MILLSLVLSANHGKVFIYWKTLHYLHHLLDALGFCLRKKMNKALKKVVAFSTYSIVKFTTSSCPSLLEKKCFGTSFEWLLSIGTDFEMNLFHPFSKHLLSLPPQPFFSDDLSDEDDRNFELDPIDYTDIYVYKCVLSRNPWLSIIIIIHWPSLDREIKFGLI